MKAVQADPKTEHLAIDGTKPSMDRAFEDAVAWMLSRNPAIESNRPEEIDWQEIKSEGRRY